MSAKSAAAKEFAKEQQLEKLRSKKADTEAKLATMTEPERARVQKRNKRIKFFALGVAAFWAVIIIASLAGGSSAPTSQVPSTPTADSGAQLSCDHFRNVNSDMLNGLLTDAEIRAKIKEIYNDAWVSKSGGIASSATAMLAADTAGDIPALKIAFANFSIACTTVGH